MDLQLAVSAVESGKALVLSGSKSETNRLLLLQALYPEISIANASFSDDSEVMRRALSENDSTIDVHHAGTAMRFLTAYFAIQPGREVMLTGSSRMKQRPIAILVDALRALGADISYLENEGFPPIKIRGSRLSGAKVTLAANVSSQYLTALLLIAPKLEEGLELLLEGEMTSVPYLKMTLALLGAIGVKTTFAHNSIRVLPQSEIAAQTITVESDWSSASYFYSIVALSGIGTEIKLAHFKTDSLQGDAALVRIYQDFGVETIFGRNQIVLRKIAPALPDVKWHLNDTPDIAQTIAVTCFGLGISCWLTGLHTLKIKETDRLAALQTELGKLGAKVSVTDDSLVLEASAGINPDISIATYNDHRMAMAFAPLALKVPIKIVQADVVSKSYPDFWSDLKSIGFVISDFG